MSKTTRPRTIEIDGRSVEYRIRRNKRARRCWLKFSPEDGLVVVQPPWLKQEQIPDIVRKNSQWITEQLNKIDALPPSALPSDVDNGSEVMFRGKQMTVRVSLSPTTPGAARVTLRESEIYVAISLGCTAPLRDILEAWMRLQAKRLIRAKADRLAAAHGLAYNRVFIRDQKTKWGSCSSLGNIAFNWRLVMAPPEVLTYMVAHELAHLRVMKHSKAFWAVVGEICPEYQAAHTWLDDHGGSLRY